ncbi:hypothetical protein RQP46_006204 [Phenoliferia psychrophenolica]
MASPHGLPSRPSPLQPSLATNAATTQSRNSPKLSTSNASRTSTPVVRLPTNTNTKSAATPTTPLAANAPLFAVATRDASFPFPIPTSTSIAPGIAFGSIGPVGAHGGSLAGGPTWREKGWESLRARNHWDTTTSRAAAVSDEEGSSDDGTRNSGGTSTTSGTRRSSAATTASDPDDAPATSASYPPQSTLAPFSSHQNDSISSAPSSLVPTAAPFVFAPRAPPVVATPAPRPVLPPVSAVGPRRTFPPAAPNSFTLPPTPPQDPSWAFPPPTSHHPRQSSGGPRFYQPTQQQTFDDPAFGRWAPPPAPQQQQQHQQRLVFPPTPPYASPVLGPYASYFPSEPLPHHQRSPSTALLQAYFGPSSIEVLSPLDPSSTAPGSASSATSSSAEEDALYLLARQTFVQQSLLTFNSAPVSSNPAVMMSHFDRAMTSATPLASLYGIAVEQAERLLEEPEKSGVGEPVLQLIRMRREKASRGEGGVCGPSANNRKLGLYKTELCRSWEEKGNCRYGTKCQFAHGKQEIREVPRHPKFKSEVCRTFWTNGSCPYGRRCCFLHATLPSTSSTSAPLPLLHSSSSAPLSTPSLLSDSAPAPVSRLSLRMSSSSQQQSSNNASSNNSPFGPSLSTYLSPSPTATPPSSNPPSHRGSPSTTPLEFPSNSASTSLGLGIKLPGRFTNNPTEVPAQFQDPPQSRLARLAALPSSAAARHHGHGHSASSSSASTFELLPTHPPRQGSSSSLHGLLQPAGNEWLAGSGGGALEWDHHRAREEDLELDDGQFDLQQPQSHSHSSYHGHQQSFANKFSDILTI